MSLYLIGDLQGCDEPLQRLLQTLDFSPSRDTLYLLGDLVNRGPQSLAVLRRLMGYGTSAQCLLGNHDLHLLAVAEGVRRAHRSDTLEGILAAPDRAQLLHWVRSRPLVLQVEGWLLVHAGLLPQWTATQALTLAGEFSAMLSGSEGQDWLQRMYGNQPDRWSDDLAGDERWRVVVNAMTRLRFCDAEGRMDFESKDGAGSAPAGYLPWTGAARPAARARYRLPVGRLPERGAIAAAARWPGAGGRDRASGLPAGAQARRLKDPRISWRLRCWIRLQPPP